MNSGDRRDGRGSEGSIPRREDPGVFREAGRRDEGGVGGEGGQDEGGGRGSSPILWQVCGGAASRLIDL